MVGKIQITWNLKDMIDFAALVNWRNETPCANGDADRIHNLNY